MQGEEAVHSLSSVSEARCSTEQAQAARQERTRAKNRKASARLRQKKKVRMSCLTTATCQTDFSTITQLRPSSWYCHNTAILLQCEQVLTGQRLEEVRQRLSIVAAEKQQRLLAKEELSGRISTADDSLSLLSDTFHEYRASLHRRTESPATTTPVKCFTRSYLGLHPSHFKSKRAQSRPGVPSARNRTCCFAAVYDAQAALQRPLESFRAHACVSLEEAMSPLVQSAVSGRSQRDMLMHSVAAVKRIKAQALRLEVR